MYINLGGSQPVLATLTEKQTLVDYVHELLQSRPYMLEPHLEDAVFGVALGGNVPIRSVVSRGVKSLTPPDTLLQVQECRLLGPTVSHNWEQRQVRTAMPAFHVVDAMVDKHDDKPWALMNFLAATQSKGQSPDFCGVRRRKVLPCGGETYEDVYELYALDFHGDSLKIPVTNSDVFTSRTMSLSHAVSELLAGEPQPSTSGNDDDLNQAQIDFFALDGEACAEHVTNTMRLLQAQVVQNDRENVLAAIMISCSGRGPNPGWLLRREMADANAFASAFGPDVPCVGFYAGGEIGPLATAPARDADPNRNLFQRGKAALQGFTAVFALFVAPKVDLRFVYIDDCPEHLADFIADQLGTWT
jgi:FIST C domain